MINIHSVAGRILIGKTIGFVVGLIAFLALPMLESAFTIEFRFGMWLFYMLLGVVIALVGVLTVHPLGFRLRWWMRGAVMGGIFHLLLVLLAYEEVTMLLMHPVVAWMPLASPYWVIVDGVILGMIIGGVATKVAGEGALPMR